MDQPTQELHLCTCTDCAPRDGSLAIGDARPLIRRSGRVPQRGPRRWSLQRGLASRAQGRTIILGADEMREATSEPHHDLFHLPHW